MFLLQAPAMDDVERRRLEQQQHVETPEQLMVRAAQRVVRIATPFAARIFGALQ
jgi:hypothetical protein